MAQWLTIEDKTNCTFLHQVNALKAICPATLDVLLHILSEAPPGGHSGGGDARKDVLPLQDLVLKCMVRMVHVVHCCSPDQVAIMLLFYDI